MNMNRGGVAVSMYNTFLCWVRSIYGVCMRVQPAVQLIGVLLCAPNALLYIHTKPTLITATKIAFRSSHHRMKSGNWQVPLIQVTTDLQLSFLCQMICVA